MIVTKNSTETFAKKEAGGKGYNLYLLSRAGFLVPEWLILGARYFNEFKNISKIEDKIEIILKNKQAKDASSEIYELITKTELPSHIDEIARQAYRRLKKPVIAVRSSAVDEDSAQHSFAGQLSSYLFVTNEEEALRCLKECWASAYSERGLIYRIQNKIDLTRGVQVGVIFQEMIDSEKSGVLFTCDPIKQDSTKIVINSVYGVGEGLVSGLLDADTFLLEKESREIIHSEIASKKSKLVRGGGSEGTQEVLVENAKQNEPSLNQEEIKKLAELGKKVEKLYRFPQDVEWGWRDEEFYLLQSRPVTTPVKNSEGLLYVWDNSNIVESYGGITMPFTFSFAHHVYHSVYVQFCEILLIPNSQIRKMDYFLKNMLGIFNGRIYYNILNWYKLTSILPGFKYNRSFMETMMGTPHSLSDEIADRIKPPGFQEKLSSKVIRAMTGLKFIYFHLTIQSVVDRFLSYFHHVYNEYRHRNYSNMHADEIYKNFQELESRLLWEWKAPIINDYLCMVHFGLLKKLTASWLGQLGVSLQNDLLCGEGKLESAEPTRELIRMAAEIQGNAKLLELIKNTASEDCLEAIQASNHSGFCDRIARYIDLYGFRCMNEMKLEERDLYQDPTFLFVCLKNYLRTGQVDLEAYEKREKEIRASAEKKVIENLTGIKLKIYLWSLKHARKAVKNRENTRFCRTRIYGVARAMFYNIGRDFTARNIIDRPEDIFYLLLSEVSGAIEGTLPVYNLRSYIELRRFEYAKYPPMETASRFMTRGPVYWLNDHNPEDSSQDAHGEIVEGSNYLKGTGCCPGIIEGLVKVIMAPGDDMDLNKEILVTLRTDPGWIPLYPSASALLVERGGLLSHSAIVAREMGLPTIVGIKGLTRTLKSGMRVRINGESGIIEILEGGVQ